MHLIISAQDIRSITFGIFQEGVILKEEQIDSSPEGYLHALDTKLQEWDIDQSTLSGLIVVTGPGSFTASRVSTTIANSIAFTQSIPVVGLENPERLSLDDLLKDRQLVGEGCVVPSYDRPPLITKSKQKMGITNVTEQSGK